MAYAFPGLHPDGYEDEGSGWPRALRRFAAEAWRRAGAGELSKLYPCDAQWAGLYDRMIEREEDETVRRFQIASDHGAVGFLNHEKRKARKGEELPDGGRLYRLEVRGRLGWHALYKKEVDAGEATIRFWQEIFDDQGRLVEIHEKYPLDKGHKKV